MSPSSPRRRPVASALLGAVLVLLVLAGCGTGQGQASNYADMEDAFVRSCLDMVEEDSAVGGARDLPDDYCQCAFDALSDPDDGVEFDTIKELNDELREDAAALPDEVTAVFEDCAAAR